MSFGRALTAANIELKITASVPVFDDSRWIHREFDKVIFTVERDFLTSGYLKYCRPTHIWEICKMLYWVCTINLLLYLAVSWNYQNLKIKCLKGDPKWHELTPRSRSLMSVENHRHYFVYVCVTQKHAGTVLCQASESQFSVFPIRAPPTVASERCYFPNAPWEKVDTENPRVIQITRQQMLQIVFSLHVVLVYMQMHTYCLYCTLTASYPFLRITWNLSLSCFQHKIAVLAC